MRWPGILVRVLGWLLTPLVAWAASFYGAWFLLQMEGAFSNPRAAVYAAFAAALITGTALMYLWIQLLRRSPRLRHTLHVDRAGLPVLDEVKEGAVDAAETSDSSTEAVRRDEAS